MSCKDYKIQANGIVVPVGFFCNIQCVQDYAIKKGRAKTQKAKREKEKQERKERAERKEKLRDRKWYLNKAQRVFNRWIKHRDIKENCISCRKPIINGNRESGHYRTTAAASQLRYNEDNTNTQCHSCNHHDSGNRGEYRIGLIKKIGLERVEALENKNAVKKWTIEELKEIIEKYKIV